MWITLYTKLVSTIKIEVMEIKVCLHEFKCYVGYIQIDEIRTNMQAACDTNCRKPDI